MRRDPRAGHAGVALGEDSFALVLADGEVDAGALAPELQRSFDY